MNKIELSNMKMKTHAALLSIFFIHVIVLSTWSQQPKVLIQDIVLQKDAVVKGAKGIQVSGNCNFQAFTAVYNNDSLMEIAFDDDFYLTVTPKMDTNEIEPAMGYNLVFPDKKVAVKLKVVPATFELLKGKVPFSTFIPYAAFKLDAGTQELSFLFQFYGKDGFNNVVSGRAVSPKLAFEKPKTRVFECKIDSLEVKQTDSKGQMWDPSLTTIDKPDLKFSFVLGDFRVNSINKHSSYKIDYTQKPLVYRFLISENDEVYFYLADEDELFDDPIANWKFNSTNMFDNVDYQQKQAKANLKGFSFTCKVGQLK